MSKYVKRIPDIRISTRYFLAWVNANNDTAKPIRLVRYKPLITHFHNTIRQLLLEGGRIILPGRLGIFQITGRKPVADVRVISWGKTFRHTRETGERKLFYCSNTHSDGIMYKIKWFTTDFLSRNKPYYMFTASDNLKQQLYAKIMKEGYRYPVSNKGRVNA